MAKIPVYNDLQVAPGNVQQVEYGRQGNLFAGLGQGLQQAGQGLEQVAQIQEQARKEAAHTKYLEASNLRAADIQKLKLEFGQKSGKDAFSSVGDYEKKIQEVNEKYAGMVADDKDASEKYRLTAIPAFADANGYLSTHAFQEKNKFDDGMDAVALSSNNNLYRENFHRQGKVGQDIYLEMSNDVIRRRAERQFGKGPETDEIIKKEIQANKSGNDLAIVQHLAGSNKTSAAKSYFDSAKDAMLESDRAKGEKLLADVTDVDMGRERASAALQKLDKTKLKDGDTSEIMALMRDSVHISGISPQELASYRANLQNSAMASEKIYTDTTMATMKRLEKEIGEQGTFAGINDVYKRALADGIDPAIFDAARANVEKWDKPTDPTLRDATLNKIYAISADEKLSKEAKASALETNYAQLQKSRPQFSKTDWEHVALVNGLELDKHKEKAATDQMSDRLFKGMELEISKRVGDKTSDRYRTALALANRRAYMEGITAEQASHTNVLTYVDEIMTQTGDIIYADLKGGPGLLASKTVKIPLADMPTYAKNPFALPSTVKEELTLNTVDDVDREKVITTNLLRGSPEQQVYAVSRMNSLGDIQDTKAKLWSKGRKTEPSPIEILNDLIAQNRVRVERIQKERELMNKSENDPWYIRMLTE